MYAAISDIPLQRLMVNTGSGRASPVHNLLTAAAFCSADLGPTKLKDSGKGVAEAEDSSQNDL